MIYLLLLSLFLNLAFVIPLIWRYKVAHKFRYLNKDITDEELLNIVSESAIRNKKDLMLFFEPSGTIFDFKQLIRPRGKNITNNFQNSYLLYGLTMYAIAYKKQNLITQIIEKVETFINENGHLDYPLNRLDQIPIGMTLIELDRNTNHKYTKAIKQIYDFIIHRYEADGRVLYITGTSYQHVDSLGMYIPFLRLYADYYNDTKAVEIIKYGVEEYMKYGVDSVTGMPAHGFNIHSKVKIGSINWGRGLGWYLLGMSYVDDFNSEKLNATLRNIESDQFPGQMSHFDSSTSLMMKIYLLKKKLADRPESLDFIKPYITKKGNVGNCSGDTYTYNRYATTFGESELCNGLLLYLGALMKSDRED